ncbi:MAG TPA: YggS family pyridoxal phosphate-dependent enzyme [Bacteroidales bacterium]|nr:YggS family pyridoxal phosphate-dependent enzyme [Bacteroidales bacterium]HOR82490.1 YggS family pyridoxal phosphate-dependent enzyme [Bacteroidales bacterium]HPJ92011.1 YggS family pyridoxal phosphate-dependent enzyme [Bacteroidales bacterium]
MRSIEKNLVNIAQQIPTNVKLVVVSKTKPIEDILQAYQAGQVCFGENKALEMKEKYDLLPKDIEWHMVGHLQTNKVKYIAPFVHLIHSVDSVRLLQEINKQALKNNRVIDCLLQFHIAVEESKYGLKLQEVQELLESETYSRLQNIRICGVMGMATFTDDKELIRNEFKTLYSYYKELKNNYFSNISSFKEVSMGMTGDFSIAIEEGSTMVRIGSAIFGERNYNV